MENRSSVKILFVLIYLLLCAGGLALLFSLGILRLNNPSEREYPIRGVDVSSYQGEIDWATLSRQGIDFAFIKATEGSSARDQYFKTNWENARNAGLKIGAYHFFSFDSSPLTQAQNFIGAVPLAAGALPPAVDIELYGDYLKNPPDRELVTLLLGKLLTALEAKYGKKPILYATAAAYKLYLKGDYVDYPIWIRDVFGPPTLPDGRQWAFWQFTDKGRLSGFSGRERFIDLNVFSGTKQEFLQFAGQ